MEDNAVYIFLKKPTVKIIQFMYIQCLYVTRCNGGKQRIRVSLEFYK